MQEVQGAEGASPWLALELCPGLSTRFWGQLGAIPSGDGVCRHKSPAGDAGKPSCPDTLLKQTEFARGNQKITPPARLGCFWGHSKPQTPPDLCINANTPEEETRRWKPPQIPPDHMSRLFPAARNRICNPKLPAGIPARASPPRGGTGFRARLLRTNGGKKEQLFGKTSGSSCWRQPGTRRGLSGRWSETRHYRTPGAQGSGGNDRDAAEFQP